jgi:asparagine synthase (glutamine-hydrolysing)
MNAALAMHGPDAEGVWLEGRVGLGYRLMRFTPEDNFERQPLVAPESRLCLVSDGRIDNRPELMEELSIPASQARQMPDSAFILRAYEKWGSACPAHLIGAFAFALHDGRENSLLLARSPRGERTLFYHVSANVFAFSTAPKGLLTLPFVPREVNRERIADLLAVVQQSPEASFFSGVQRLRQGQSILVRPEGWKTVQYWSLNPKREIRFTRDADYVEAFHALFDRVIGDNLRSITPVGVMMSGGLDSTSVAALAAERLSNDGARLSAFTEVPPPGFAGLLPKGRYADETPYAIAMARRHRNLDLNLVCADGRFFLDDMDRCLSAAECPIISASNRHWWEAIIERAALQGRRVLLTGSMGNFTISWAGSGVLPGLIRSGKWKHGFREMRALARSGAASSIFRALGQGIMPILPNAMWLGVQRLRNRNRQIFHSDRQWRPYSAIRPEFARQSRVQERARENGHSVHLRPRQNTRFDLLPVRGSGEIACGYEAMFGLQTRNPANDQRIVEFCLAVPEDQYLRDGTSKWLIRRTMADRLPPEILSNPLRGLQSAGWFERYTRFAPRILEELELLDRCGMAREAIDLPRLRSLVASLREKQRDPDARHLQLRMLLDIGVMVGRFLRWVESGN